MTTNNNGNFYFKFGEDFKTDFITYVNEIITVTKAQVQAKREAVKEYIEIQKDPTEESLAQVNRKLAEFSETLADRQLRMKIIEELTDCYVAATGERPEPKQLGRLTDAILNEELTDQRRNKMQAVEYSFMSEWQLDVRHDGEYSEELAENHGSDGKNHRKPTRRKRLSREDYYVNKYAKSANEERSKKYREFTKVQPVITRWITEDGELSDVKPEVAE